ELDEERVRGAPGERLQADRPGARVQVGDAQPVQGPEAGEDRGEQALPRAVARGARVPSLRHVEPPSSRAAREDPGDLPSVGGVRAWACAADASRAGPPGDARLTENYTRPTPIACGSPPNRSVRGSHRLLVVPTCSQVVQPIPSGEPCASR